MPDIASICVYCGSSHGTDLRHRADAARFGRQIGEACLELVYGGGDIGLMGTVADAAMEAGGRVTGVIPTDLKRAEVAHAGLDELIVVGSMHERKRVMFERADAFVALPGGYGTLEELTEILSFRKLRLHHRGVVLLDLDGYYRGLIQQIERAIAEGFDDAEVRSYLRVTSDPGQVVPLCEATRGA